MNHTPNSPQTDVEKMTEVLNLPDALQEATNSPVHHSPRINDEGQPGNDENAAGFLKSKEETKDR